MEKYIQFVEKKMFSTLHRKHLSILSFQKNDYILKQGQSLEYLYILVEGKVKTCHTSANGSSILNAITEAVNIIGEVELLLDCPISNDIIALTPCILFGISIPQHKEAILQDSRFMEYLAKSMACKLYHANHNASISINYSTRHRLASYLIACQHDERVEESLVQIAETIGCSYRQCQRVCHEFIQQGYIKQICRGHYQILNSNALKKLSQDIYYLSPSLF